MALTNFFLKLITDQKMLISATCSPQNQKKKPQPDSITPVSTTNKI